MLSTTSTTNQIPEACCWTLSASADAIFYLNSNQLHWKTMDMREHTRSASAAGETCPNISITTIFEKHTFISNWALSVYLANCGLQQVMKATRPESDHTTSTRPGLKNQNPSGTATHSQIMGDEYCTILQVWLHCPHIVVSFRLARIHEKMFI
jgi:hypothetical protein